MSLQPMVRRATLEDLDFLVHGNQQMARETENVTLDDATIRSGILEVLSKNVAGRYYVLESGGNPVGQLMITFEWSDWRNGTVWWIQSVYVTPELRGKGYFGVLYRHVRNQAAESQAVGVRLYVENENHHAQAVYSALGMNGDHYRVFEDMFGEPEDRSK